MSELSADVVAVIDKAIVRSPYAELLGVELAEASEGCVRLRLAYRDQLTTYGDTVHGGAIAALIDVAATAAFWASESIAGGSRGATIGFSVSFLAPARGSELVATARVRRRGREISSGDVSVCDADGREVAAALVNYKLSPPA